MRVFNIEEMECGCGYDTCHRDNMEIVMLPLSGALEYGDDRGNNSPLTSGEAQIISAGTGIVHNLYNRSKSETAKYIQLWIYPREYELEPEYTKIRLSGAVRGEWQEIASPCGGEHVLPVGQNVWLHMTELGAGDTIIYGMQDSSNGVYVSVLSGEVEVAETTLKCGDGLGLHGHGNVLKFESAGESKIMVAELPMQRV